MLRQGGWGVQRERGGGGRTPQERIAREGLDCGGAAEGNGANLLYKADAKGDELKATYG